MAPYQVSISFTLSIIGHLVANLHAQVGIDHFLVVLDFVGGALGDLLAEVQHRDLVGDVHHQAHVVLDQQDGDAPVADLKEEFHQGFGLGGVQPGRRLVEQEELRIGDEGPCQLEHPLPAVGQTLRLRELLAAKPDKLQRLKRLQPQGSLFRSSEIRAGRRSRRGRPWTGRVDRSAHCRGR